jgi:ArsR family metal-binding transcriptional regulator
MLLNGYRKRMIWSQCRSKIGCLRCLVHLEDDISQVIPYLNTVLRGYQYLRDPLAVTFKVDGKLIAVYANRITINNLADEAEADRLIEWLKEKINETWARRDEVEPRFEAFRRPNVVEILKALRDTDCRACGETSCVAYAVRLAEGTIGPEGCSLLPGESKRKLIKYLQRAA